MSVKIKHGDCLLVLKGAPDNSMDSLITDPPAGISFMGKSWDDDKGGRKQWVAWMTEVMTECYRVLKPGAHGLVWALPRTSHWTATALEDAGFEIRDVVTHLFGTGFPKSMNLEKAGAGDRGKGLGTALKPASEHWILVRKPCSEKTVAANVLKWGTGGINIDASRIGTEQIESGRAGRSGKAGGNYDAGMAPTAVKEFTTGRFPANLVLDEEAAQMLDEQSGTLVSKWGKQKAHVGGSGSMFGIGEVGNANSFTGDSGGASRFFYVAKASKSDKGADNTHPTVKSTKLMEYLIKLVTPTGGTVLDPFMGSGSTGVAASALGFDFVGIEQEQQYLNIAEKRLKGVN